ncbi:ReoY family proteolytic degradation factor [Psychrobacillus antarcticus]|uniref:ReoY family proteolytic degradation factor n=1 Tax=Psychrobacillus antarcticus TaxID=2879115 RepID=UPI002408053B|nr:ReoY family proteolytic degradation factor [Psychrobacillus antarcticus]
MTASVSVGEKKEFVRWFLKKYQMKRRECVWILNYLISHETLLNNVHFVEEAHYCPRAMIMSVTTSSGIPFRFYKGSIMTADAEKSFHDLRLHPEEDMYIQLNFQMMPPSPEYLAVLEENPYMPKYLQISEKDKMIAEDIVMESLQAFQMEQLKKQIDQAIDENNKEKFMELSSLWKQIQDKEV